MKKVFQITLCVRNEACRLVQGQGEVELSSHTTEADQQQNVFRKAEAMILEAFSRARRAETCQRILGLTSSAATPEGTDHLTAVLKNLKSVSGGRYDSTVITWEQADAILNALSVVAANKV